MSSCLLAGAHVDAILSSVRLVVGFGPGRCQDDFVRCLRRRLSLPTVGELDAKGLADTRWRCRIVNVRVCKSAVAYMGAIGASFEFGWMRVRGREGVDSARCKPPALVEVTAVSQDVSF